MCAHVAKQSLVHRDHVRRYAERLGVVLDVGAGHREGAVDRDPPDRRRVDRGRHEHRAERDGDRGVGHPRLPEHHHDRPADDADQHRPEPVQVVVVAMQEHDRDRDGHDQRARREDQVRAPAGARAGERRGPGPDQRCRSWPQRGDVVGMHDPRRHAQHDRLDDEPAAEYEQHTESRVAPPAAERLKRQREQTEERKPEHPRALTAIREAEPASSKNASSCKRP